DGSYGGARGASKSGRRRRVRACRFLKESLRLRLFIKDRDREKPARCKGRYGNRRQVRDQSEQRLRWGPGWSGISPGGRGRHWGRWWIGVQKDGCAPPVCHYF